MRRKLLILGALLAAILATPSTSPAADGRREISQASILAAGGFPYVISAPGSYVLTSDLAPPPDVIGIRVDADDVNVDLNGFAIRGSLVCVPGSCSGTGPSGGISVPTSPLTNGRRCSVRSGTIAGINGSAINLRDEAFVDAVSVSNTFFHGIILGPRSLATRNRITAVGRSGLLLGAGSGYGQNVVSLTGLFLAFGSVSGGKPVGGNVCDDGRCPGARRFYLTQNTVNGAGPLSACDAGFHMASRWEIEDPSSLRYDTLRGFVYPTSDQGVGPPAYAEGWVRTGFYVGTATGASFANCGFWTNGSSGEGTLAQLLGGAPPPPNPWSLTSATCSSSRNVWCVEDD